MADRILTSQTGCITARGNGLKTGLSIEIRTLLPFLGPISAVRFGSRIALPFSQHLAGRKGPSQGRQRSIVRQTGYM